MEVQKAGQGAPRADRAASPSAERQAEKRPKFKAASFRRRFAALLLDGLLVGLLCFTVLLVGRAAGNVKHMSPLLRQGVDLVGLLALIGACPVYIVLALKRLEGTTPGKHMLDMKVIRRDGESMSLGRALVREIALKVILYGASLGVLILAAGRFIMHYAFTLGLLMLVVGLIARFCGRLTFHDLVCGTRVVRRFD